MKNSEYKFRAWCKSSNYMVYDSFSIRVLERYDHENCMQFTGKKDINEKEIYEGDIVSVHQFLFDGNEIEKEWIAKVVYIDELCGFGLKVLSGDFALSHTGYETYEEMPAFLFSEIYGLHEESFKVLGNVFENQDVVISS